MDDVIGHIPTIHAAINSISGLAAELYAEAARVGTSINHQEFVEGALDYVTVMLRGLTSREEKEKTLRFLSLELGYMVRCLGVYVARLHGAMSWCICSLVTWCNVLVYT
jgi:hypothetical protein